MFMENLEEGIELQQPLRTGNISRSGPTGLYSAKDGDVIVTVTSDDQWRRLATALDAPELLEDPRYTSYHSRTVNVEAAREDIQGLIGKLSLKQALTQLSDADVPCAPVRTAADSMADQHFWDRGSLTPMRHGALDDPVEGVASGFPVIFSGGPLPPLPGAPTLGMHNQEVLGGLLGLTPEEVRQLQDSGVV
jgi:crotonobetainyl-CoA:carnitine CoA-transferase CaiB-like acyl-CoA transferase